jgi:RNA polymerase sigma-70 factor (ECF subfamily)
MNERFFEKSDEELMILYQTGREDAFDVLYRRYSGKVFVFLRKRLNDPQAANDAFQATFIKLHRSRDQFNSTFMFAPWIFTIARTVALDAFKKKNVDAKYFDSNAGEYAEPVAPQVDTAEPVDLSSLPAPQRSAVEMRYLEEMSFEEIAIRLETSPSNVRQIVSRGVKHLRSILRKGEKN